MQASASRSMAVAAPGLGHVDPVHRAVERSVSVDVPALVLDALRDGVGRAGFRALEQHVFEQVRHAPAPRCLALVDAARADPDLHAGHWAHCDPLAPAGSVRWAASVYAPNYAEIGWGRPARKTGSCAGESWKSWGGCPQRCGHLAMKANDARRPRPQRRPQADFGILAACVWSHGPGRVRRSRTERLDESLVEIEPAAKILDGILVGFSELARVDEVKHDGRRCPRRTGLRQCSNTVGTIGPYCSSAYWRTPSRSCCALTWVSGGGAEDFFF